MKRIYSLDLLRGLAIFFVIALHEWEDTYNMNSLHGKTFADVPRWLAIIGFVMFILGHSRSFFLFISMIIHSYILAAKFENDKNISQREKILLKNIVTGGFLYILGIIETIFLCHDGFLMVYIKTGKWDYSVFGRVYIFDTLQMIGSGIIIISLLLYSFYYISNWKHKTWHNYFFGIFSILIIYLSPVIRERALQFQYYVQHKVSPFSKLFAIYVLPLFWAPFRGEEAMFPYLGVAFIGAIIGLELARPLPNLNFPQVTAMFGIILMTLGIFQLYFMDHGKYDLWFGLAPTWFILLDVGIEIIFTSFFFWKIDFNPEINTEKFLRRTIMFRRWGIISLSVYMLQIIDVIPRGIFGYILGINFFQGANLLWSIFMVIVVILFWNFVLQLWEQVDFIGSWEWMLVIFNSKISKQPNLRKRLNVQEVLYQTQQINFSLIAQKAQAR